MTQEEKQLLFTDLCTRLPYGCILRVEGDWFDDEEREPYDCKLTPYSFMDLVVNHDCNVKPYLRPMSSMALEEIEDLAKSSGLDLTHRFADVNTLKTLFPVDIFNFSGVVDWLNAHHFDYRGLIPMGLALEAKEEMYKTK